MAVRLLALGVNRRTFLKCTATGSAALTAPAVLARTPPPRLRIGQVGLAHPHAAGKLKAIQALKDTFELIGVVEPNAALRRRAPNVNFISMEELMNTRGLKAVAIETRVRDLVTTALPVVQAGKHIHLDKPAGPELATFRKLLATAETNKLCVQMGYMLRYNPAFEFMFRAAREGWFGEIMELDAMMGKQANAALRRELAEFSGGGFFELACHILDAAITVLGKPDRVLGINLRTGAAKGDTFADNQLAVLNYPRTTATLRCNHNDPFGFPRRRFHLAGTRGGMEIQQLEGGRFSLNLDQARGPYKKGTQTVQLLGGRSYVAEFTDLARVIRGEKKLAWSYQHDLTVHETLLKVCDML